MRVKIFVIFYCCIGTGKALNGSLVFFTKFHVFVPVHPDSGGPWWKVQFEKHHPQHWIWAGLAGGHHDRMRLPSHVHQGKGTNQAEKVSQNLLLTSLTPDLCLCSSSAQRLPILGTYFAHVDLAW